MILTLALDVTIKIQDFIMLIGCGFILFVLYHVSFARVPYVEPEFLNMLRETGRHEEFARYLGIENVSLVHPVEGRMEEDLRFNRVSHLGDILLTPEQEEQDRQALNFKRYTGSRWPNKRIPYAITTKDFNPSQIRRIESAIRQFNARTKNIKITPRNNEKDYVQIISGSGCYSNLGRVGGQQVISLQASGCLRHGTVQHEFMHALGFQHEHCRPDRDDYVYVYWENISQDWRSQYEKGSARTYETHGPYDYYSVMHYPMDGTNGKDAFYFWEENVDTSQVGQRTKPSDTDFMKIDNLYA